MIHSHARSNSQRFHREFGATAIPSIDCDLIILAGDIATKQNALSWIRDFSGEIPTIYVCGNHEFYGDKLPRVTERIQAATAGSNIHMLENTHVEVNGWHIYGCSLWTDLALVEDWESGALTCGELMNDYKKIRNSLRGYRRLAPVDTRAIHLRSLNLMEEFLQTHDPRRSIIVTHHAPSARSLPENRRGRILSSAYASNLDAFVERYQPFLWIHGHIHHNSDYSIGKTRVIANPQGYPEEINEGFDDRLLLTI